MVDLDDADLLEEVGHRLHGVVVSQALHEDGVIVGVILVLHCRGRQRGRGSAGAIHKWLVFGEGESVQKNPLTEARTSVTRVPRALRRKAEVFNQQSNVGKETQLQLTSHPTGLTCFFHWWLLVCVEDVRAAAQAAAVWAHQSASWSGHQSSHGDTPLKNRQLVPPHCSGATNLSTSLFGEVRGRGGTDSIRSDPLGGGGASGTRRLPFAP